MAKMYIETLEPSFFGTYRAQHSLIHAVAVSLAHGDGGIYIVEAEYDTVSQRSTSISIIRAYTHEAVTKAIAQLRPVFVLRQIELVAKLEGDWRHPGVEVRDFGDDFPALVHRVVWLRGVVRNMQHPPKPAIDSGVDMVEEYRAEKEFNEEFERILNYLS